MITGRHTYDAHFAGITLRARTVPSRGIAMFSVSHRPDSNELCAKQCDDVSNMRRNGTHRSIQTVKLLTTFAYGFILCIAPYVRGCYNPLQLYSKRVYDEASPRPCCKQGTRANTGCAQDSRCSCWWSVRLDVGTTLIALSDRPLFYLKVFISYCIKKVTDEPFGRSRHT